MCGSTHIFRNHQGVELMGYDSNGNGFDRIVRRVENATKAEQDCAFLPAVVHRQVHGESSRSTFTALLLCGRRKIERTVDRP